MTETGASSVSGERKQPGIIHVCEGCSQIAILMQSCPAIFFFEKYTEIHRCSGAFAHTQKNSRLPVTGTELWHIDSASALYRKVSISIPSSIFQV